MDEMIDRSCVKWYILHTLSGKENKVQEKLKCQIALADNDIPVYEVLIPMEKITEIKNGKQRIINRKIFPGYVYIRMDLYNEDNSLNDKAWSFVRNVQGVITFVGSDPHASDPDKIFVPHLSEMEVQDLIRHTEEVSDKGNAPVKVPAYIVIGGTVRIIDGAFANFEGVIQEIDVERGKLKLMVSIFGRSTPVELEFWQVGPDEE